MWLRSMARWVGLLVVLTLPSACAQQYNGSVKLKQRDKQALATYHRFLEERDLSLNAAAGADARAASERDLMTNRSAMVPSANVPRPELTPTSTPTLVTKRRGPTLVSDRITSDRYPQGALGNAAEPGGPPREGMGNLRHITFATEGADFDPAVAPDGKWLVFASTRHRADADLYLKRVDASAVTQLTGDPGKDVMPAISPDGKTIAFTSSRAGNWDLYLMDIAGGQPIQLTHAPEAEIHPSFSPDGKWLVYCQFAEPAGRWELVLLELANPSVKRFIGYGLFPNWSPTENRIVFQRARERDPRWYSIWAIELVDGEALRPTEIVASANAAAITPDWSPDGKHIVFCTVMDPGDRARDRARQSDIWVVDIDGRNRVNLTRSQVTNLQPVWACDGTIYYTSNRGLTDGENVWSLRPDRALQVARRTRSDDTASADGGGQLSDRSTAEVTPAP